MLPSWGCCSCGYSILLRGARCGFHHDSDNCIFEWDINRASNGTLLARNKHKGTTEKTPISVSRRAGGWSSEIRVGLFGKNYLRFVSEENEKMEIDALLAHPNMAPIKRGSDAAGHDDRPSKRPKSTAGRAFSILKEDAPFPRGGASVLTPLEHRQIKIQAKKDVLFEQSTGKKAPRYQYEDAEFEETPEDDPNGAEESKPAKGKPSRRNKRSAAMIGKEKAFRIDSLSYKACSCSHCLATLWLTKVLAIGSRLNGPWTSAQNQSK